MHCRMQAHRYRRQVLRRKEERVLDRQTIKSIKSYARERFGSKRYWPYLALYTEIRGQFQEGWLPYDYYRYTLVPRSNPKAYRHLSALKTFDFRVFGDFAIRPLFLFISGRFFDPDMKLLDETELQKLLEAHNDMLVLKDEFGFGGKQIQIIHSSEFKTEQLVGRMNCIIQPYIYQYKVLNDLYPGSVNTFRVTTFLDKDESVRVKFVVLRFGIDGSKIDNLSSGGQYMGFDLEGHPSDSAYEYELGFNMGQKHRNTEFPFEKVEIPMFGKMLEMCKKAHLAYPYLGLIGWDVCIDQMGEPKLIEWNAYFEPVFWPMEAVFGPYWKDEKFKP